MDVLLLARTFTGFVLFVASVGKWLNMTWFQQVVAAYRLLPSAIAPAAAVAIAALESLLGLLMISGIWEPWASVAACALIGLFSVAVLIRLWRGETRAECGCSPFGGSQTLSWYGLLQNVGLLGLASLGAIRPWLFTSELIYVAAGASLALFAGPSLYRYVRSQAVSIDERGRSVAGSNS